VKIVWKGKEYPLVEKLTGGDVLLCERKVGLAIEDWSRTAGTIAYVFASVHRLDDKAMTWDELAALDPEELNDLLVLEPGDNDPEGGEGSADPLGDGSAATSNSSGARGGRRAAGARSKSAAGRTSSTSRSTSGSSRGKSTA
jgi:hypothetical protein